MIKLIWRIRAKIWALCFPIIYGRLFKSLGSGSFLMRPFRLDGSGDIEIATETIVQRGGWLYCDGIGGMPALLKFGKGCVLGHNNHIAAVREVVFGEYVLTANNVYVSDNLHEYEDISSPVMHQPVRFKAAVSIGDGSWIGENACIIGARIGKHCVIGANSVVTHDVPDYSVVVGSPGRVIRQFDLVSGRWLSAGSGQPELRNES